MELLQSCTNVLTLLVPALFSYTSKYICIVYDFTPVRWHRYMKSVHMEDSCAFILKIQYHACRWLCNVRSQDIGSYDINPGVCDWKRMLPNRKSANIVYNTRGALNAIVFCSKVGTKLNIIISSFWRTFHSLPKILFRLKYLMVMKRLTICGDRYQKHMSRAHIKHDEFNTCLVHVWNTCGFNFQGLVCWLLLPGALLVTWLKWD